MTQNRALLLAVEQWHKERWADLAQEGIKMTLRPATTNRNKNIASIDFETADRALSAVVWDSGESEVLAANKYGDDAPVVVVHVVESAHDVVALLNRVHSELMEGTE